MGRGDSRGGSPRGSPPHRLECFALQLSAHTNQATNELGHSRRLLSRAALVRTAVVVSSRLRSLTVNGMGGMCAARKPYDCCTWMEMTAGMQGLSSNLVSVALSILVSRVPGLPLGSQHL
jgi:hypothetical protein